MRMLAWPGIRRVRQEPESPRRSTAPLYRLLLHVGLHKTGTTAVQTALAAAAGRLRERHLLYPKAGRPADFDGHHNVAWQLAGDHRFRPAFGTVNDVAA